MRALPVRRDVKRLLAVVVGCYLYGRLVCLVPAPTDPEVFWIANLVAPFTVGAVVAGLLQVRLWTAALAGSLATVAMVAGFYRFESVGLGVTAAQYDLPATTSGLDLWLHAHGRWFDALLWGNLPWLLVGALTGLAFGSVGFVVRRRRGLPALVVGGLFVAEGLARVVGIPVAGSFPRSSVNVLTWSIGMGLGLVLAAAMLVLEKRSSGDVGSRGRVAGRSAT